MFVALWFPNDRVTKCLLHYGFLIPIISASGDEDSVMDTSVVNNTSVVETDMSMNDSLFSPTVTEKRRRGCPKGVSRKKTDFITQKVLCTNSFNSQTLLVYVPHLVSINMKSI